MVPAALADARKRGLAKAHLEFVTQYDTDDEVFAVAACPLTASDRSRDDIGWVGRILLPVDVVVIHYPDHQ